MGDRFVGLAARQHPDLIDVASAEITTATGRWARRLVLAVLTIDGVLSAVAAVFLLQLRIGSVPFPISALISGLVNAALVWAAMQWTSNPRVAVLPLWSWLLTVAVLTFGGPGGDIAFGGVGLMAYAPLLLIVLGVLPPAAMGWGRRRQHPPRLRS